MHQMQCVAKVCSYCAQIIVILLILALETRNLLANVHAGRALSHDICEFTNAHTHKNATATHANCNCTHCTSFLQGPKPLYFLSGRRSVRHAVCRARGGGPGSSTGVSTARSIGIMEPRHRNFFALHAELPLIPHGNIPMRVQWSWGAADAVPEDSYSQLSPPALKSSNASWLPNSKSRDAAHLLHSVEGNLLLANRHSDAVGHANRFRLRHVGSWRQALLLRAVCDAPPHVRLLQWMQGPCAQVSTQLEGGRRVARWAGTWCHSSRVRRRAGLETQRPPPYTLHQW